MAFDINVGISRNNAATDTLPSFICAGEAYPKYMEFHSLSYVKQGELSRLISLNSLDYEKFSNSVCKLFGCNFLVKTACINVSEKLFYTARLKYNCLQNAAFGHHDFNSFGVMKEYYSIKDELIDFLAYFKTFVSCMSFSIFNQEKKDKFLLQIKSLLLHLGRLYQLPRHFICSATQTNCNFSTGTFYFHLHLDIVWAMIEIFYILKVKSLKIPLPFKLCDSLIVSDQTSDDLFSVYVHIVLCDLVHLALLKFQKLFCHEHKNSSPYQCTCIREFWFMLRNILDDSQKKGIGNSFWVSMQSIFHSILHDYENIDSSIDSDVFKMEPCFKCEDRIGFAWWLLYHLLSLYHFDTEGNPQDTKDYLKTNYSLLNNLVSLTFQSEKLEEAVLRSHLQLCYEVCQQWDSCSEILLPMWGYFFKHINSNFSQLSSLDGFPNLCDSGTSWIEVVKKRIYNTNIESGENSFQLFLRLVGLQFKRSVANAAVQDWKQFKGRVYVKFHAKKMNELNDSGLHNFISLFLTMACVTDFDDVSLKMCDLLDMISIHSLTHNQRYIIWCGMFALLHLSEENNIDLSTVAGRLASLFSSACQEFTKGELSKADRHQWMKLFFLYVKEMQIIMEQSNQLALSEFTLIVAGFENFLTHCTADEVHFICSIFLSVLTKQRLIYRRIMCGKGENTSSTVNLGFLSQHKALATSLWKGIYPFVKKQSLGNNPSPILADIAAGLTVTAYDIPSSVPGAETIHTIFSYFGLNFNVNQSFTARYLCHILSNQDVMDKLMKQAKDFSAKLIGSWIRCVIFISESDNYIQELSRLINKMPDVKSIMSVPDSSSGEDHEMFISKFFKALNSKYNSIQNFGERINFRHQVEIYFQDTNKAISSALKNPTVLNSLRQIYIILGHLVKYSAHLIYVKSKAEGLLHSIMNTMILPRIIFCHDKPLPSMFSSLFRETLHFYIHGLLSLNPSRDPCIYNFLKDVVIQTILRFPLKSQGVSCNMTHPLLMSLQPDLASQSSDSNGNFLAFVLEVIRDHYLIKKLNSSYRQQSVMLSFVIELMELSNETVQRNTIELLLLSVLNLFISVDEKNLKLQVLTCLKLMMSIFQKSQFPSFKSKVISIMQEFIHQQMKNNGSALFRILEFIGKFSSILIKELNPCIVQQIQEVEDKRGVGYDNILRDHHRRLLLSIGVNLQQL